MLTLGTSGGIFLAVEPQDGRKGIDGLAGVVVAALGRDPTSGDRFVFINRKGDRLKILAWEGDGFALYLRRLVSLMPVRQKSASQLARWKFDVTPSAVFSNRKAVSDPVVQHGRLDPPRSRHLRSGRERGCEGEAEDTPFQLTQSARRQGQADHPAGVGAQRHPRPGEVLSHPVRWGGPQGRGSGLEEQNRGTQVPGREQR